MDWKSIAILGFLVFLPLVPVFWDLIKEKRPESLWTAVVAVSTCVLVAATMYNAYVLNVTDGTLRETLEGANRAWLSPTRVVMTSALEGGSETPMATLYYQNVGRDPALNVRVGAALVAVPLQIPLTSTNVFPVTDWDRLSKGFEGCKVVETPVGTGAVVFPSSTVERTAVVQFSSPFIKERILNGEDIVIAFSCLSYRTFGHVRHSASCDFLHPVKGRPTLEWSFKACPVGNFAD